MSKKALLVLAFGGPGSLDEVEPFIKRVLRGREVPPPLIEAAKRRYAAIGGSSPLPAITERQAVLIGEGLKRRGEPIGVYTAMLNWHPFIADTVKKIAADGVDRLYVLVMSSHTSPVATGGYNRAVKEAIDATGQTIDVVFVEGWHTHPLYLDALRETIKDALSTLGGQGLKPFVLFTAHSLPEELVKADPYVERLRETIDRLALRMELPPARLAFQSKGGRGRWLEPTAEDALKEAAREGFTAVCVVPLGFVADHVETLYDLDIALKAVAEEAGLGFVRACSLNTTDRFIEALVDVVWRRIRRSS